jgi:hypothetical protein
MTLRIIRWVSWSHHRDKPVHHATQKADDSINRLLADSFSSEPMTLTRIIVDEYAVSFVTPQFTCESYQRVAFLSPEGTRTQLDADFRKRDASAFTVLSLVGKTINLARVENGQLTLVFDSGEQIVLESSLGRESFVVTFADGRGIYLFSGGSEEAKAG